MSPASPQGTNQNSPSTADTAGAEGESMTLRTEKVVRWVVENLGGRVTHVDPQARWRPVWFIEVERD